jgi:Mor family transcriptional regulator
MISIKKTGLNKTEENELRQIIEVVIEEFQDHFGQALNLSIKQMSQHLLSNINLFYNHYQQEFEQLTKKYRLAFLERFIELMKKFQTSQMKTNNFIQQTKPSRSGRVIRFYELIFNKFCY